MIAKTMIAKTIFTKEYCNVRFLSDPDMADKVNAACRSQIRKRMQHNRNNRINTHGAVKPILYVSNRGYATAD